ncbi:hypothetical protein [Yoonia sp. SS1-5]|uniref:Uncharacterized protein n=1 Tax=Yoonia rhodophyticola TaxID=3137370 RepID=A0AAN0MCY3_9RHOB
MTTKRFLPIDAAKLQDKADGLSEEETTFIPFADPRKEKKKKVAVPQVDLGAAPGFLARLFPMFFGKRQS